MLGLVEAVLDGRPLALGGAKQRAVLAMLALHANERVSADRLIDGLWGERSPPSAPKNVQLYISQLRRLLEGHGAEIVTRGRGYELRLPADAVDAKRFERLVGSAEAGDAGTAAEEALALWRGAPLDDLADAPFAPAEARRLEELWVRARELAVDGALAAGRHGELVPELDELIAAHPLRERLHAQRMLALYRSGRQADALAAYQSAHAMLAEGVGVAPGPELRRLHAAILEQDPSLELPVADARTAAPPPPGRRPRRAHVLAGAAVLCLAVAGVVALQRRDDAPAAAVTVPPDAVAVIDPRDDAVVAAVRVDEAPGPIAAGAGMLWVLNRDSSTVSRIDIRGRRLLGTLGVGDTPGNVAASEDEAWAAVGCVVGGDPGALSHLYTARDGGIELYGGDDVPLDAAASRLRRPGSPQLASGNGCGLAADGDAAWIAANVPPGVVRVDYDPDAARSRLAWARPLPRAPAALAVAAGALWAVDAGRDVVRRIDAGTGRIDAVVHAGTDPVAVAADAGAIWVANEGDDSVSRIDPRTNTVSKAISVGDGPTAVASGDGAVWVAAGDGSVTRIDPRTDRVVATIQVGHRPEGIALAGGVVWVTVRE